MLKNLKEGRLARNFFSFSFDQIVTFVRKRRHSERVLLCYVEKMPASLLGPDFFYPEFISAGHVARRAPMNSSLNRTIGFFSYVRINRVFQ